MNTNLTTVSFIISASIPVYLSVCGSVYVLLVICVVRYSVAGNV